MPGSPRARRSARRGPRRRARRATAARRDGRERPRRSLRRLRLVEAAVAHAAGQARRPPGSAAGWRRSAGRASRAPRGAVVVGGGSACQRSQHAVTIAQRRRSALLGQEDPEHRLLELRRAVQVGRPRSGRSAAGSRSRNRSGRPARARRRASAGRSGSARAGCRPGAAVPSSSSRAGCGTAAQVGEAPEQVELGGQDVVAVGRRRRRGRGGQRRRAAACSSRGSTS